MRILFLDQSGQLGGAELCLLDLAQFYGEACCVALFEGGPFADRLTQAQIPTQILSEGALQMRKHSGVWQGLANLDKLWTLIHQVAQLAEQYDLIYVNTPKALVVGAMASLISRRPLAYHLHDIISAEHFSRVNQMLLITLANRAAKVVIANSIASQQAFEAAGGKPDRVQVIYNGFAPDRYRQALVRDSVRQELGLGDQVVIGHFSRLSPWKGQHVLIEALQHCPANISAVLVGDALFGETDYVEQLHEQIERLGLADRVQFLGFRADIPELMAACDLVVHTSIAPEPFGRVIVEAMLCGTPVIAAAAGGAMELVQAGETGWLVEPGQPLGLAAQIRDCVAMPDRLAVVATQAQIEAEARFDLKAINLQISHALSQAALISESDQFSYS
jgi:glycosyltransferase involved in cell wall biosynthesis